MKRTIQTFLSLSVFLLFSCAVSKALYLGSKDYVPKIGPQIPNEIYNSEDINGVFPEAVYIKTRTQTFNSYHYYILRDGLIWYKSIDTGKEPAEWTLFQKTGLPHNSWKLGFNKPKRIVELSADADELVALSDRGGFYRFCFDKSIARKSGVWLDRQGWPAEEQLFLDRRTSKNIAWALGKRNSHVLYYEDTFGNQHHNGTMEIATTYMLLEDGQEICYADTGLISDFSRNYIGPERGAFKAVSLSASASTMFVINEAGEMYTRLADFDTIGCDPMWFKYTYVPYKSDLPGDNYFSNLNEWGLPAEDWRLQPRIPLTGKAAITRHITILQNGQGNGARELRVAGRNGEGESGYWSKAIFADSWEFKTAPLYFSGDAILEAPVSGNPPGERGPALDKNYTGYQWTGGQKENDWEYEIPNFNILEGACDFRVTRQGETCTLKLHPVEMWTYLKRDYLPGRTGSPKLFLVTLEIPEGAFENLSDDFVRELEEKYAENDRKPFQYTIAASNHYIFMRESANTDSVLFLTDGILSNTYHDFQPIRHVENYAEIQRYYSPDLMIDPDSPLTIESLAGKIALNKTLVDELKYKIRTLNWAKLTAFKFNIGYIPASYVARITPLRFIDVPKIRTITSFGEKIVLANSTYTNRISELRAWVYQKIIDLLELRIACYTDMAKQLESGENFVPLPPWYSEHISDYWDIAELPRQIEGSFFPPKLLATSGIPAALSFYPQQTGQQVFGWYLAIGQSSSYTLFIDPKKSVRTIYKRKGSSPHERAIIIDCTLYINPAAGTGPEQTIVEQSLAPFIRMNHSGIDVRITFDGEEFEIREHPKSHSNATIFRGKAMF
ncbi:hypothetical protein PilKf_01469 [Pillotina sp. SPG140]